MAILFGTNPATSVLRHAGDSPLSVPVAVRRNPEWPNGSRHRSPSIPCPRPASATPTHTGGQVAARWSASTRTLRPRDVCRKEVQWGFRRLVIGESTCAAVRRDRIPSRAPTLYRPTRISCHDTTTHGCAYPVLEALPIRFRPPHAAFLSPPSIRRRRTLRQHHSPADASGVSARSALHSLPSRRGSSRSLHPLSVQSGSVHMGITDAWTFRPTPVLASSFRSAHCRPRFSQALEASRHLWRNDNIVRHRSLRHAVDGNRKRCSIR